MQIHDRLGQTDRLDLTFTVGVRLLTGLTLLLVATAPATDLIGTNHLSLAYLVLIALALGHDAATHDGIASLVVLQVALVFAIVGLVTALTGGGLGSRRFELGAVFVCTLLFVLARDDLPTFGTHGAPYLVAFATLFGIFLAHSSRYAASSGLALFPVFAGVLLGLNLFVVPRYVSQDAVYWSLGLIAAGVSLLALPTVVSGDYSIGVFEVRTWTSTLPIGDVPISRSIYANPNTLGLVVFPGTIASVVAARRTYVLSHHPTFASIPLLCFPLTVVGLVLSNSRAAMLAAAIGLCLYVAIERSGARGIPLLMTGFAIAVGLFLVAIFFGVLPIDPANRFTLWRAGLLALLSEGSPLGAGLVGTSEVIEPYLPAGAGAYSVHNSYLSIALRAGFVGGLAYLVLVVGPLIHAIVRPAVSARTLGMLAIASGFAVHQLFEAYTLYQFGPGSILGALAVGYVIESLATPPPRNRPE